MPLIHRSFLIMSGSPHEPEAVTVWLPKGIRSGIKPWQLREQTLAQPYKDGGTILH